ncbi:hypothetical protein L2E82_32449 [Cichorium intybus]|uniref:Uncharacterized protein n=1 Tax=Cichorium intybus TaxID=13427 RepID=A0ACB9BH95_CICIN|nr:hypothetical protein L2E82_32449 [Cichorium intybus]
MQRFFLFDETLLNGMLAIRVVDVSTPDDGVEVIDICSPIRSNEAVPSSPSKMCYTMQFSFEEFKKRRHQKLLATNTIFLSHSTMIHNWRML